MLRSFLIAYSKRRRVKRSPVLTSSLLIAGTLLACGLSSDGQSAVASAPQSPVVPSSRPEIQPRRDLALIQRLTPRVEIWRPNSNRPQIATRRTEHGSSDPAFVSGTELVTVRLRFSPQSAGEKVTVIAGRGVVFEPPQQILTVSAQGDCAFQVQLAERAPGGHLITYCRNLRTVVPLVRARSAVIQAREAQAGGQP
jgi:hypothetical protein